MKKQIKNIDLDAIELAQVADFDHKTSSYGVRLLEKRAIVASKVGNIGDKHRVTPERDSAFQRMLSGLTGLFKPKLKTQSVPDALPCADAGLHVPLPESQISIVVRSKQQLRTLYYLMNTTDPKGIPIDKLKHLVGSGNQWDTVARLNHNVGERIVQATEYLVINKTGKATRRANYWLTAEGRRIAPMILANSGYTHDAASEGRHLHRPGIVAAEFLAMFSLDDDDLLVLRDGTKSQWLRLLYLLRAVKGAWVPRYVADEILDSCNVRQVVRGANGKVGGHAIESTTRTMPNRDSGVCEYGLYRIADDWVDMVDKVIADTLASTSKVTK